MMPTFAGSLEIMTSPYLGDLVSPQPPARVANFRGPYQQRKLRRWHLRNPAYYRANGKYLIVEGRYILCHPADEAHLRQAVGIAADAQRRVGSFPRWR